MPSKLRILGVLILGLFILNSNQSAVIAISLNQTSSDLTSDANLDFIENSLEITVSDPTKYQDGLNVFGLYQGKDDAPFRTNNSYLLMVDMDGKIQNRDNMPVTPGGRNYGVFTWINKTSVVTNVDRQPFIWNMETNVNESFDMSVNNHHDLTYNPNSDTFLVIERYVDFVTNQTGDQELMLVDRIHEYDRDGNVVWEWNALDYVNTSTFFEYYINDLNWTSTASYSGIYYPGTAVYNNIMHTNSIFYDEDDDKIYINMRRMNQFVKIDHATGETDWIAGWNGDFELFSADGTKVKHLWYTPHDVRYLGNDEFIMFDNGNGNVTSIQNDDPESQRSSILHIRIDEKKKEIHEVFRWTAPKEYYSFHWGSASLLPNGNYLGGFSSWYHQWDRTLPAYTEEFGGVAVEVTPEGEVVWEMRMPYLWGFFRIYRYVAETFDIIDPSPVLLAFIGIAIVAVFVLIIKNKAIKRKFFSK